MARLRRLVVPGEAHYLIQRAHGGPDAPGLYRDGQDLAAFDAALLEAAAATGVQLHSYSLNLRELQLLATPADRLALGRMLQALARRYVSAYNRKYLRRGSLWEGRFRCAVVEPGEIRLAAMRLIDGQRADTVDQPQMTQLPEVWQLGNTPFEREAAYRSLLAQGVATELAQALRRAALGGWAAGSADFVAGIEAAASRPARPRPKGRPSRAPA